MDLEALLNNVAKLTTVSTQWSLFRTIIVVMSNNKNGILRLISVVERHRFRRS